MSKSEVVHVGIDVAARELVVAISARGQIRRLQVGNDAAGHKELAKHLKALRRRCRVCLEATGVYSLDLAFALVVIRNVEVMVANPRSVRNFAEAMMARGKSDPIDSVVLMEYAARMPFTPWHPPSERALELRAISRRLISLSAMTTATTNRQHTLGASKTLGKAVRADAEAHRTFLAGQTRWLEEQALALIEADTELNRRYELLISIIGIGTRSAIRILGELSVLAADMTARQWVGWAGLDPIPWTSGPQGSNARKISKRGSSYLRQALYMPALVAIQHSPVARDYYERLVSKGKPRRLAIVAIMRKLLHWIHAIFASGEPFQSPERPIVPPKDVEE